MSQRCLDFEADLVICSQGAPEPTNTSRKVDRPGANAPPAATRSRVPLGIGLHLNSLGAFSAPPKSSSQCEVSRAEFGFSDLSPESGRSLEGAVEHSFKKQGSGSWVEDDAPASNTRSNAGKKKPLVEDIPNKPAAKRKRGSSVGTSCKGCSCKKSKCLKLYCECFANGSFCLESCGCRDCSNKPEHEETVLDVRQQIKSKNPLAFAPKVVPSETPSDIPTESGHPASKHKRGCKCKRSLCLKKYCECFQAEVGCSESCKCTSCKNTFGVKQGSPECTVVDDYDGDMMPSEDATDDRVSPACFQHFTTVKDFESPVQQASTCSKSSSNFHTFGTPFHSDVSPELSRSRTGTPDSCHRQSAPRTNLITRAMASTSSRDRMSPSPGFRSNSLRPGLHTLQSKVLEDGVHDFLLDPLEVESPTVTSSPKKKRVTASQVGVAGKIVQLPPVLKNGRKLTLQALPSLPPVSLIREQQSRET